MYENKRNMLVSGLRSLGWNVQAPKGSFFAWLKIPDSFTSESFAALLLDKAKVAIAPGNGFGRYGEGYVRVGLLTSEERLCEAVERIKRLAIF